METSADRVREQVREGYATIAAVGGSCCSSIPTCCGSSPGAAEELVKQIGYSAEELAALPEGANMGLSCGNPNALAALQPGEVVLDLGAGGGFDVFIASRNVGPTGRAIGVDMTPEMLSKARRNLVTYRESSGLDNVEFLLGEIEHLPVPDNSVDVVISNCVINLSPYKPQVWREIFRVLKPGGRVVVSDLALLKALGQSAQALLGKYWKLFAGVIAVIFGLAALGLMPVKLPQIRRKTAKSAAGQGILGTLIVGLLLGGGVAACSLPCNPGIFIVLGASVLQGHALWGMFLMAAFALGFSLPLAGILLGVSFGKASIKAQKVETAIRIVAGVVLVGVGLYLLATF